ncbi:alpha/beta hydrolase [Nocardia transvalensis]|uniref:alpha/beta hydrolase n=1 Tax=Nocardia transvalensis TaxID=37333 RepID=UPI003A5CF352
MGMALTRAAGAAVADPVPVQPGGSSADGSRIAAVDPVDDRSLVLRVYSAAMDRDVEVHVQRPADPSQPRPTLYLLNGAGGGEDAATWEKQTDVLSFLATKDVNVVEPVDGKSSYYTDWRAPDPTLGVNKWRTFLTEELPPLIDPALGTDRANALVGMSMSGTSALQLAIAAPGFYRSVAALSGCAQISDPIGHDFVATVVAAGGGDARNMYGPPDDPMWAANDPYVHADQLRGENLFISSGSGLPGQFDTLDGPRALPGINGLVDQVAVGGAIEAATNYCTRNLQAELDRLGIPATYDLTPTGTHSWGYWETELKKSWAVLAAGLGLPS